MKLGPFDRVFVHGNLIARHAFVETVASRHHRLERCPNRTGEGRCGARLVTMAGR